MVFKLQLICVCVGQMSQSLWTNWWELYRFCLQKNIGPHSFCIKFEAVSRQPWKSFRGVQVANHWFCALFSLQASMKPMPSKLAFLLNLKQMKNLPIYKCVFSILSLTVQQRASAQQGHEGAELPGPLRAAVQIFPCTSHPSWWPHLFLFTLK